jgi:hypothetical protein
MGITTLLLLMTKLRAKPTGRPMVLLV